MEHTSLYRRFRPDTFDKVIGQEHIVRTLVNQIKNGRVGHAYLFTGSRGTGKTTCAKIFARAVNCLHPVNGSPCGECEVCKGLSGGNIDILEMDAASNNGVDEIRELKENVQYRPTVGKYKVYIVDEVHMLSASAFNALLKTLEEPPEHVIFILATTEVQKIPQTILSRCMRFDFHLVSTAEIKKLLLKIFAEIGVDCDEKAANLIASCGEGCVRDALSIADLCVSYCGDRIAYNDALNVVGANDFKLIHEMGKAILEGNVGTALKLADRAISAGRNTVGKDLAKYFTDLLNLKNVPDIIPEGMGADDADLIKSVADNFTNYRISRAMDIMCRLEGDLRYSSQPKVLTEAAIVRAAELQTEVNVEGLTNRLRELEKKLNDLCSGTIVPIKQVVAETPAEKAPAEPIVAVAPINRAAENVETPKKTAVESAEESVENTPVEEVKTQVTATEKPVTSAQKPKKDVNDLLKMLEGEEVEAVFEDRPKLSDADIYRAGEIWGKVILRLNDGGNMILRMAASCIESGYRTEGNNFVLETEDNATFSLFNRPEYHDLLQNLIREESGKDYVFSCVKPATKDDGVKPEDKLTLDKLFSGEIKIKPRVKK